MNQELRELLESAAHAMGFTATCLDGEAYCISTEQDVSDPEDIWYVKWMPHLDSADGAEMEARLQINITWTEISVEARDWAGQGISASEEFGSLTEAQSARRMASLRVAAAIGKAMKNAQQKPV